MKKVSSPRQKADRQGRLYRKSCYNRGHNYEDTHYVFLQQSDENGEDENGLPLYRQQHMEDYLEKELEPGDTLQTLAIQFNCPIAELKRINHIHRENEVFARRKIKVPVKYYSLLSEKLVGVHKTPQSSKEGNTWSSDLPQCDLASILEGTSNNLNHSIQEPPLQDEVQVLPARDTHFDNCDTDVIPLLQQNSESVSTDSNSEVFQCNGSDWGLSWPHLLICTLLLGFAGPIVYIFYLKETIDEKNGPHNMFNNHTLSNHMLNNLTST